MRFTLRQMEVFVEIARSENVSRAAEALSLSQSAASAALAELENQFDQQLFDRNGKRLRLNDQGSLLLPHAVELLDRAAEIEALLRGAHGAYRDVVLLNAAASLIVAGKAANLKAGVALAAKAIDEGAAFGVLARLRALCPPKDPPG